MKFEIERSSLADSVAVVAGIAPKRAIRPVFSHLKLSVGENCEAVLEGTDGEIHVVEKFLVDNVTSPGVVLVPADKFSSIVRSLPDGKVKVDLKDLRMTLRSKSGRYVLTCLTPDEFPEMDVESDATAVTIGARMLGHGLSKVSPSMGSSDVRDYLNGALLCFDGNTLYVVATDAHRLSLHSMGLPTDVGQRDLIIPRKAVDEIVKMLTKFEGDTRLSFTERSLELDCGLTKFKTKLIAGRYPDWRRIPDLSGAKSGLKVAKDELKSSLARALILASEKVGGMKMKAVDGSLVIDSFNPDNETVTEEISAEVQGDQPADSTGCNIRFMQDAVKAVENSQVDLRWNTSDDRIFVLDPESQQTINVIMPMRI